MIASHLALLVLALASWTSALPAQPDVADAALFANTGARKAAGYRLISISDTEPPTWKNLPEILALYHTHTRFIDVTDQDLETVPVKPSRSAVITPLLPSISIPSMTKWLTTFTTFKNRYYKSPTGKQSADWLYAQAQSLAALADKTKLKVTVSKFAHEFVQFSVIVRVEAAAGGSGPITVLSAHQDSADDDGSGSVTIFETLRVLIQGNYVPKTPLEFHWYAAEEAGLLGSQKVVADYKRRSVAVNGAFQLDMTGYTSSDPSKQVIGIATDNVDATLQNFVKQLTLIHNNSTRTINTACGYGCSDHASWNRAGYPAAFLFETAFEESNPRIHSANDKIEYVNWKHVEKFARVAVAYAVEMSS
ncbi:hypothetical protein CcCBS67573_g01644 [Chytriomyces confervae]|uniref:Peptide hydrolase n=1 Tax=Chytriomyces confervae TaxID=246404 RepID=A0A507FLC3_9FUNG|nr:hypothetical protein CcCBS67573_g01644 [Chytriomyces confervae]